MNDQATAANAMLRLTPFEYLHCGVIWKSAIVDGVHYGVRALNAYVREVWVDGDMIGIVELGMGHEQTH